MQTFLEFEKPIQHIIEQIEKLKEVASSSEVDVTATLADLDKKLVETRRSVYAGVVMWCFAAIVMLGSVALGWHYAVDGYAGALITIAIWKAVGKALSVTSTADEASSIA